MSKSQRKSVLPSEPSHGYEFGGPLGAFATSFGLPLVCYLATFLCNDVSGCPIPSALHPLTISIAQLKEETGWPGIQGLASVKTTSWVLGYYLLSLVLHVVLPGVENEGVELQAGGRLKYKFNGRKLILCDNGDFDLMFYSIQLCTSHNCCCRGWHLGTRIGLCPLDIHLG